MVKDQDTPYLGIVRHVLATMWDDQEEYIRAVTLIVFDGYIRWTCGFCSSDKGRNRVWVEESSMMRNNSSLFPD